MRQGNLAVQLPQKDVTVYRKKSTTTNKKKVATASIPVQEKLIYLAVVIIFVLVSSAIISRYALISEYNYEIQNTRSQISELKESNRSLQVQIDRLSSRERIIEIARNELGMVAAEENVKVISSGRP
ncbi:MAG: cell division protein FtsL [Bacillaceae bacterium]|nr:cell division protein FtsL [Bacillaceae bacterium]